MVDTTGLVRGLAAAQARVTTAESTLAATRRAVTESPPLRVPVTLAAARQRDSLLRAIATLSGLLQRASTAPLAASYRALGEAEALHGDARVRALVDSLIDVERERDDLGGGAAVDPVYVALTTRANALGRAIQSLGEGELLRLRRVVDSLAVPVPVAATATARTPDTVGPIRALASATAAARVARQALARARRSNAVADSIAARARDQSRLAPLPVLLVAAIVVAFFVAFSVTLADEMRSPRVAGIAEAERLSGLRVLTLARLRAVPPERSRRAADRTIAPLLDPTSDEYRILAWHIISLWPREGIVTVSGDQPVVTAVVGANLAAVLAADARTTLLVDTDFRAEPVRCVLDLPRSPGLAAVLENRRKWSESLLSVPVGRSQAMDVLPSGLRERPVGPAEGQALVNDIVRAARRHDATVVVAAGSQVARARAGDDVVICAVQGSTRLATLARAVASLIDAGARVRGIVLWEGRIPNTPRAA